MNCGGAIEVVQDERGPGLRFPDLLLVEPHLDAREPARIDRVPYSRMTSLLIVGRGRPRGGSTAARTLLARNPEGKITSLGCNVQNDFVPSVTRQ